MGKINGINQDPSGIVGNIGTVGGQWGQVSVSRWHEGTSRAA